MDAWTQSAGKKPLDVVLGLAFEAVAAGPASHQPASAAAAKEALVAQRN
jgi:hypothetical protein